MIPESQRIEYLLKSEVRYLTGSRLCKLVMML